jgi:SAM-dependent methyltransferase
MDASTQVPDERASELGHGSSSGTDRAIGDPGRQRLWAQFSYVARSLAALLTQLVADAAVGPGDTVVDYGCGEQPYRSLFSGCDYIGVDLASNPAATVHIDSDGKVPLADACADLIFSTQVLEHVKDPDAYLRECHRMLRPGGTLILTTHGVMFLHRHPADLWRWTCDGLRLIVERVGLTVADQRGVMTLTAAALQLMQHARLTKARTTMGRRLIGAVFQSLIAFADRRGTDEERRENGFVLAVRAIKPE